jgi:hypothetical protein
MCYIGQGGKAEPYRASSEFLLQACLAIVSLALTSSDLNPFELDRSAVFDRTRQR